ncbi:Small heat shock protein C3 [Porphyridium purpureum]|uniref:Small heat shock protein C3 n=1 Tax=Porphyridium purpureum TaxID=35688 RepID=A0A5J4YPB7_PORPP|nr:Small heat shock protein C3 [Porphyridium purpureum]|eukprot:POR0717..scf296_7
MKKYSGKQSRSPTFQARDNEAASAVPAKTPLRPCAVWKARTAWPTGTLTAWRMAHDALARPASSVRCKVGARYKNMRADMAFDGQLTLLEQTAVQSDTSVLIITNIIKMEKAANAMAFMFGVVPGARVYGVRPSYSQASPQTNRVGGCASDGAVAGPPGRANARAARYMVPSMSPFGVPINALDLLNVAERMMTTPFDQWDRAMGVSPAQRMWSPLYRYEEFDDKYVLYVEAAGIPKEKVVLEVKDNVLLISANMEEKTAKRAEDTDNTAADAAAAESVSSKGTTMDSFRKRSFERRLTLSEDIVADNISAAAKDGIISVTLPKRAKPEAPKPKRIEIVNNTD